MSPEITFSPDRLYRIWNGLFLTRDDLTASYAIIRHNIRTYQSAGVLAVVRVSRGQSQNGRSLKIPKTPQIEMRGGATSLIKPLSRLEQTPLKPRNRQAELEGRESKALRGTKTTELPSPDPKR